MNYKENQKSKMFAQVMSNLESNADTYQTLPNYNTYFLEFVDLYKKFNHNNVQLQYRTGAYAKIKKDIRMNLIKRIDEYCNKLKAYLAFSNEKKIDKQLKEILHLIHKVGADTFIEKCKKLYSIIESNLEHLSAYGLNADSQHTLMEMIESYEEISPKPKMIIDERSARKSNLGELIKEMMDVLYKIDVLLELLKYSKPDIHLRYFLARRLEKPKHRKNALMAKVIDEYSLDALKGVKVIFTADTPEKSYKKAIKPITKTSSTKGGFNIHLMKEAYYQVKAILEGYEIYEGRILIQRGQQTRLEIKMQKTK